MTTMSSVHQERRILEAAKELFTQRGFSNVAVRDICRAAKVTPPTVYYYFKNKEALFEAVVRETISMSEFIARLSNGCKKGRGSLAQLRSFTRTYLSHFPKEVINVGLYIRHSTELDPVGRQTLSAELARAQSLLIDVIREGIAKGEFRDTSPRMAAECLLGMMNRFIFQRIHFQRNYDAASASSYLTDFFLRAMREK